MSYKQYPITVESVVELLNRAFRADECAVHAIMCCNAVPCSGELAADPDIQVRTSLTRSGFTLSALGIVNGILSANQMPDIEVHWEEINGQRQMLGFRVAQPQKESEE